MGVIGAADADPPKLELAAICAFIAGFFFYALHRAVIYPHIERTLTNSNSAASIQWLKDSWLLGKPKEEMAGALAKHFKTWADYTHFLYVAGLCTIGGTLSHLFVQPHFWGIYWLIHLAAILLGAGHLLRCTACPSRGRAQAGS